MPADPRFEVLLTFLRKVPAVDPRIGSGVAESGLWWAKFHLDIDHPLAWARCSGVRSRPELYFHRGAASDSL
jgi:hypothetical protein